MDGSGFLNVIERDNIGGMEAGFAWAAVFGWSHVGVGRRSLYF